MKSLLPLRQVLFLLLLSAGLPVLACAPKPEVRMVLQVQGEGAAKASEAQVARTAEVLRNRLDMTSVEDPEITADGDRISIRAAGVEDPARLRRLLLARANLELRFVRFPERGGADSREAVLEHFGGDLPPDVEILEGDRRGEDGQKQAGSVYYAVEKRLAASGEGIESARPTLGQFDQPILAFKLKPEAAAVFGEMTGANIGRALAIVLNGKVLSAPVIQSRIIDSAIIEGGGLGMVEIQDLATVLLSGALPASVTVVEEAPGSSR